MKHCMMHNFSADIHKGDDLQEEGEPSRGLRVLLFSPLYIVRIYK